jgi:hypothetical protein
VLQTGFRGIFSLEVFDSGKDGKDRDLNLHEIAQEDKLSIQKLVLALQPRMSESFTEDCDCPVPLLRSLCLLELSSCR